MLASDPTTLSTAITTATGNAEFMANWRRLCGSRIGLPASPIERLVDQATGFDGVLDAEARALYEFIRDHLFVPAVADWFKDAKFPPSPEWISAPDGGVLFAVLMSAQG